MTVPTTIEDYCVRTTVKVASDTCFEVDEYFDDDMDEDDDAADCNDVEITE